MKPLQLIIPMSGAGSRFQRAGYTDPKPLIQIHSRPMIEWVLRMFPGEEDPLFICRQEHLNQGPMGDVLRKLKPSGKIAAIQGHKTGPIGALVKAASYIDDDRPVLVSYCDYYMHWDYAAFKQRMHDHAYDGAVPCYSGFHPHLLPMKNLYASCKVDMDGNLLEIREKHSFTADKALSFHSPGAYYFRSGALLKQFSAIQMERCDEINGEYYASTTFNHMVAEGLKVDVSIVAKYFCQWGTPEDLQNYLYWMKIVRGLDA